MRRANFFASRIHSKLTDITDVHGTSRAILAGTGAIISLVDDPGRVFDIVLGHGDKLVRLL